MKSVKKRETVAFMTYPLVIMKHKKKRDGNQTIIYNDYSAC